LRTATLAAPAAAQCVPQWLPSRGLPGADVFVAASVTWDPDGPSPEPDARHPLGQGPENGITGTFGFSQVSVLRVVGGQVLVGGLDLAGGVSAVNVAAWDGTAGTWFGLGDGSFSNQEHRMLRLEGNVWLDFPEAIPIGSVTSMAVYKGRLVLGGDFEFSGVGDEIVRGAASSNGHHWRALGPGVSGMQWGSPVQAMEIYRGKLIVAGQLDTAGGQPANAIASWDGVHGQPLDSGLPFGDVWALAVDKDELVATGQFLRAGEVDARCIARWDRKQWRALDANGAISPSGWGRALAVTGDDLYVGGGFWSAGGVEVHSVARWNGAQWHAMEGGVDPAMFGEVGAVARIGNEIWIGGNFTQTGTGVSPYLARWGCR
jgi:trimeric autotransporter adhesin